MGPASTRQLALATFLVTGVLYAACAGVDDTPFEPVEPDTPGVSFTLDLDGDSYSCDYELLGGFIIQICTCDDTDNAFFYSSNQCLCVFNCVGGIPGGGGGGIPGDPGAPPPGGSVDVYVWCAPTVLNRTSGPSIPVTRGQSATCDFMFSPPSTNVLAAQWRYFPSVPDMPEPTQVGGGTWEGDAVLSGMIFLSWNASNGQLGQTGGPLQVAARSAGIWTQAHWNSKLTFIQGQGSLSCQQSQRAIPGVRLGWTGSADATFTCMGQRIEPVGSSAFTIGEGTGPNDGMFYVSNASYFFKSTSQLHQDVLPGAPTYVLTDTQQANVCRSAMGLPPGPVTVNFWQFNGSCQQVAGWSGFVNAAWDHERQHSEQAETALMQPGNNIYIELEDIVEPSSFAATGDIDIVYNRIQDAATVAGNVEPTGNWTTPFWLWTSDVVNAFSFAPSPNFSVISGDPGARDGVRRRPGG